MKSFRVIYEYLNQKRILLINPNKKEELKPLISQFIQIDAFQIKIKTMDAIVNFSNEVFEGDELIIEQISLLNLEKEVKDPGNQHKVKEDVIDNESACKVTDPGEYLKIKIKGKDLLDYVNAWAISNSFKVKICEGYKVGKKGVTRTLMCREKNCNFRLTFFSEGSQESQTDYNEIEYSIKSMKLEHNHKLESNIKETMSPEIIEKINIWKGKTKTLVDLKDLVNQEFQTNYDYHQISYQASKLMNENFGKADDDADSLVREIEKDIELNGGHYEIFLDKDNKLQKILYMSFQMLEYAKFFLDIVIVDATYRRNRFNMPLVNICGIDNFGGTIFLAFALINDEKKESYDWLFSKLREIWKSNPIYFISDECKEIIQGIIFNNFLMLYLLLGIEKNFNSRRLLCAWHIQRNFVSKFTNLNKTHSELYDKILALPFITKEEKFQSTVEEALNSENLTENEKEYLNFKLESKYTWAKCFIKHRFGAGISTTSRVEGLHKVLQDFLNSNSRLTEVFAVFRKIESHKLEKFKNEFNRHSKNIGTSCYDCFLLKELSLIYSPYVIKKMEPKISKALSYKYEEVIPGKSWYFLFDLAHFLGRFFMPFMKIQISILLTKKIKVSCVNAKSPLMKAFHADMNLLYAFTF